MTTTTDPTGTRKKGKTSVRDKISGVERLPRAARSLPSGEDLDEAADDFYRSASALDEAVEWDGAEAGAPEDEEPVVQEVLPVPRPSPPQTLPASPLKLEPPDPDALGQWVGLYYQVLVAGAPAATERAKRADLEIFVGFFLEEVGHDRVDGWTPAVSRHFQRRLCETPSTQSGRPYRPTTVNRVMATVRHFGRWLHKRRPLLAGNPLEGVRDLVTDPPDWNGLSSREVLRLKSACEQRLKACTRKDQNPLLEAAVFHVLINTGLRESELCRIDMEQYYVKGFHQVPRKGKRVSKKVPVPRDARHWLDRYIEERRGGEPGPLFVARTGNRLAPADVARICQRLCRQANAHVPVNQQIHLTPHMLRHTFLKRVADKHGVHVAQRMSGNVSIREVFRYTKPSDEEMAQTAEELFQ